MSQIKSYAYSFQVLAFCFLFAFPILATGEDALERATLSDAYQLKKGQCLTYDVTNKQTVVFGTTPRDFDNKSKLIIYVLDDAESSSTGYKILSEYTPESSADNETLASIIPNVNYMKPNGELVKGEGYLLKPFLPVPKADGLLSLKSDLGVLDVRANLNEDGMRIKYSASPDQAVQLSGISSNAKLIKSDYLLSLEKDGLPQSYASDEGLAVTVLGAGAAQFVNLKMELTNAEVLNAEELTSRSMDALALIAALGSYVDKATTASKTEESAYASAVELVDAIDAYFLKYPNSKYNARLKKFVERLDRQIESMKMKNAGFKAGDEPMAFELLDVKGTSVSLAQFKDKIVLLDFWASWCGPCRASIPGVKALYEKYKDKGLVVLGLSCDQDKKAWKVFVEKEKMTWPNLLCTSDVTDAYGILAIPSTYIIGKDGKVIARDLEPKALEEKIDELMK